MPPMEEGLGRHPPFWPWFNNTIVSILRSILPRMYHKFAEAQIKQKISNKKYLSSKPDNLKNSSFLFPSLPLIPSKFFSHPVSYLSLSFPFSSILLHHSSFVKMKCHFAWQSSPLFVSAFLSIY